MKKIVLFPLLFCISLLSAAQVLRCGTVDDFDAKFNRVGQFHNDHLANVVKNFAIPEKSNGLEEALNRIAAFNKKYFLDNEKLFWGDQLPEDFTSEVFNSTEAFVIFDRFKENLLGSGAGAH